MFINSLSKATIPIVNRAKVYFLLGQSNSNGEGLVEDNLPENLQEEFNNIFIINRNTTGVEKLQYLVNNKDDLTPGASVRDNAIGQELELGRLLHNHYNQDIYFIKVATGGVGIHAGQVWSYIDGYYHTIFENYHDELLTYFQDNNIEYDVEGLVWVQGEDSANDEINANNYFDDGLATFNRIRNYVGVDDLPVIQIRLRTDIPRAYPEIVREKQELLASTYPETIFWVNSDDLVMIDGGIHYDMESQIILSNRIFNILKEI